MRRDIEPSEPGGWREEDACDIQGDVAMPDEGNMTRPGGYRRTECVGGRRGGVHSIPVHDIESWDAERRSGKKRVWTRNWGTSSEDEVRVVGK